MEEEVSESVADREESKVWALRKYVAIARLVMGVLSLVGLAMGHCLWAPQVLGAESGLEAHFNGLRLGLTFEAVSAARPRAVAATPLLGGKSDEGARNVPRTTMLERTIEGASGLKMWKYEFVDGRLSGISISTPRGTAYDRQLIDEVVPKYFVRTGTKTAVRLDGDMNTNIVEVEEWERVGVKERLFVIKDRDVVDVNLFAPGVLTDKDFFITPKVYEQMKAAPDAHDAQAQAERQTTRHEVRTPVVETAEADTGEAVGRETDEGGIALGVKVGAIGLACGMLTWGIYRFTIRTKLKKEKRL